MVRGGGRLSRPDVARDRLRKRPDLEADRALLSALLWTRRDDRTGSDEEDGMAVDSTTYIAAYLRAIEGFNH